MQQVLETLERIAPLRYAEPWDNVGLLLGDRNQTVTSVLLTIDCTPEVVDEAAKEGCELIVSYHPPLFKGVTHLVPPHPAYHAVRWGIAVYSPHTALDAAPGGTNDLLITGVGVTESVPLRLMSPAGVSPAYGMGRTGVLAEETPRSVLFARVQAALQVPQLLVAGPTTGKVTRVAVCAGAGEGLLDEALRVQADLYLTGELRHHEALRAARHGMTVVCTLHSHSERAALQPLAHRLRTALPTLSVLVSRCDRDPFVLCGEVSSL